jgi:hypothetical protein
MSIGFQFESFPMVVPPLDPQPPFYGYTNDLCILDGPNIWLDKYVDPYDLSEHLEQSTEPFIDFMFHQWGANMCSTWTQAYGHISWTPSFSTLRATQVPET